MALPVHASQIDASIQAVLSPTGKEIPFSTLAPVVETVRVITVGSVQGMSLASLQV